MNNDPIDTPVAFHWSHELPPCTSVAEAEDYTDLRRSARNWREAARAWLATSLLLFVGLVIIIALSGCTTVPRGELAWQAMHTIDTAQTVTIAHSPECLYEADPLARIVYGSKHPSAKRVIITNTIGSALHWGVGEWLDHHGPAWTRHTYISLSLLGTGISVGNNTVRGVRPLAGDLCEPSLTVPPYAPVRSEP